MNVIRHNDITANSPAMPAIGRAPFADQNFGDFAASKKRLSIASARRHKINRGIDPNTA